MLPRMSGNLPDHSKGGIRSRRDQSEVEAPQPNEAEAPQTSEVVAPHNNEVVAPHKRDVVAPQPGTSQVHKPPAVGEEEDHLEYDPMMVEEGFNLTSCNTAPSPPTSKKVNQMKTLITRAKAFLKRTDLNWNKANITDASQHPLGNTHLGKKVYYQMRVPLQSKDDQAMIAFADEILKLRSVIPEDYRNLSFQSQIALISKGLWVLAPDTDLRTITALCIDPVSGYEAGRISAFCTAMKQGQTYMDKYHPLIRKAAAPVIAAQSAIEELRCRNIFRAAEEEGDVTMFIDEDGQPIFLDSILTTYPEVVPCRRDEDPCPVSPSVLLNPPLADIKQEPPLEIIDMVQDSDDLADDRIFSGDVPTMANRWMASGTRVYAESHKRSIHWALLNAITDIPASYHNNRMPSDEEITAIQYYNDIPKDNAMVERVAMKINYLSPIKVAYKTWPSGELDTTISFNVFSTMTGQLANDVGWCGFDPTLNRVIGYGANMRRKDLLNNAYKTMAFYNATSSRIEAETISSGIWLAKGPEDTREPMVGLGYMFEAEGFCLVASNPTVDGAVVLPRTTIDGVDPAQLSRIDPGMSCGKDGKPLDGLRVPANVSIPTGPSPLGDTLPDYSSLTKQLETAKLQISDLTKLTAVAKPVVRDADDVTPKPIIGTGLPEAKLGALEQDAQDNGDHRKLPITRV